MTSLDEIIVGTLYSQHGPMSTEERLVLSALDMAFDEINRAGGILGKQIRVIQEDGQSDPDVFALKAEKLLGVDGVSAIFGCWTSSSRKSVKPVIEKFKSLLWYPVQYEGLEQSKHIIYTGACLNQQIYPAVIWALQQGARRFFLIGSDYVFPRTANHMIRTLVEQGGGTIVGETLISMGEQNLENLFAQIKAQNVDIIFNTINGESNLAFFRSYSAAGLDWTSIPVVSFSFSEIELINIQQEARGTYACWSYFQGSGNDESAGFLRRYQQRYGSTQQVSDPVVTAYTQVYLWKHIVEKCGSFAPQDVLRSAVHSGVDGPAGWMEIQANNHVRKPAYIGQVNQNGGFEVVWQSQGLIDPQPWLGLEDIQIQHQRMIRDALEAYPEVIHLNWSLQREITRREEVERLLKKQSDELEIAKNKAEMASQAKSAFLAGMSHELRTPLTGILSLAELLEFNGYGQLTEKQLKYVRGIETSGNRLLKLINRVIEFTQLQAGDVVMNWASCSLPALGRDWINQAHGLPGAQIHQFEFASQPAEILIEVDERKITQAVMELLENAIKFTPQPGNIRVSVVGDIGTQQVRISITDTGIGIKRKDIPRLFVPFTQLDDRLARVYEGAGLGLTLAKNLVELHGGSIDVESKEEQGSCFTITIPWKKRETVPV